LDGPALRRFAAFREAEMVRKLIGIAAATCLAAWWPMTADATVVRAWVSGKGNDITGCGAPTNACRTLQYTFDNIVSAGGEIDILDPAGYGTIGITHAISIVNDGVGTAGVQAASGVAITISAGANDAIRLKGLNIEGLGTGFEGIQLNAGASLTVEDCTIKDFNFQVKFAPHFPAFLYMSNTRVEHAVTNGFGINIDPLVLTGSVHAVLEHVEVDDDGEGILIDNRSSAANVPLDVTISDSVFSDASCAMIVTGVHATGPNLSVLLDNSTVSNNSQYGVLAEQGATIVVSRSKITGNATAFFADGGGVVQSYGDNRTTGNTAMGLTPTLISLH
jgi:Periplasmic copper-binding protein (NosD)